MNTDSATPEPTIEFLYWTECPSHEQARARLETQMVAVGLDATSIHTTVIESQADAEASNFTGSPTIRINGADIVPTSELPALACRVYRRRDGRPSPLPDIEDLQDALRRAVSADHG